MEGQTEVRGIDVEAVTRWFREQINGVQPPLSFSLIAGGHSNLTFKVTDAAGPDYGLRRPPLSHVLVSSHDVLKVRIPPQGRASVVVGDYRLGNCITETAKGQIVTVLDWEICPLGDPLADLGYVLVTWTQSTDPVAVTPGAPSLAPGFPNR